MHFSKNIRNALFATTAVAGLTLSPAASAQDATEAPTAGTPAGDIIVTGTRVVRDGYQAPTPLTVLTAEEIANTSPTNNIADFVNQLPALAGSTRPSNSRLNISSGQAGINALNLRNFGETRTLVLLNGRRSVASTITGVVDVNTIPQMLVERVDVVTGGASASYGSDAVAGVVNFIMRKDFEGVRIEAQRGIFNHKNGSKFDDQLSARDFAIPSTNKWDGQSWDLTAVMGTNSADGKKINTRPAIHPSTCQPLPHLRMAMPP